MNYQVYKKGELISKAITILAEQGKIKVDESDIFNYVEDENLRAKLIMNKESDVSLDEIEYEEFPRVLLKFIGYIPESTGSVTYLEPLLKKYNFNFNDVQYKMIQEFNEFLVRSTQAEIRKANNNMIYPHLYLENIIDNYPFKDIGFAFEIVESFNNYYMSSPVCRFSKYGNVSPIDLKDLFELEANNSKFGEFIDRRYITFLKAQHDKIGDIHWRKFEELSAQFYKDEGYEVIIGPGRKDGGRDVFAKKGNDVIIIQCKRLKNNVGVGTVKELHDDVSYYKEKNGDSAKGVIFCNNDLSSDSKELITKRNYTNIKVFNKEDIIKQLEKY